MHVVAEQPQMRWYPATLDELLWIVKKRFKEKPPVTPESHVCGSHWAMSKTAVTTGQMIETSTPVHEDGGDQAAPRLNHVLYDVIPKCMTEEAKNAFRHQDVQTFNPAVKPDFWPTPMKFYLFHVESGMRIYELYSITETRCARWHPRPSSPGRHRPPVPGRLATPGAALAAPVRIAG